MCNCEESLHLYAPASTIGAQGPPGPPGETLSALGVEADYASMVSNHPTPNVLDAYILQDTSHFWVYDPTSSAANVDGWVDMGSLQGPPGLQGLQGLAGNNGISAFVYAGFWDKTQSAFSYDPTSVPGGVSYMKLLVSTVPLTDSLLSAGDFVLGPTITYVSNFIPLTSGGGTGGGTSIGTLSRNFLSGRVTPTGTSTLGDLYLYKDTTTFWYYDGSSWLPEPGLTFTTMWEPVPGAGWVNAGWSQYSAFSFRQSNTRVEFQSYFYSTSDLIADTTLMTVPSAYRPIRNQFVQFYNANTGEFVPARITTAGVITLLCSKVPIQASDIITADLTSYSLT